MFASNTYSITIYITLIISILLEAASRQVSQTEQRSLLQTLNTVIVITVSLAMIAVCFVVLIRHHFGRDNDVTLLDHLNFLQLSAIFL